jgi:NADPH-dependent curcumin reductase CurA
VKNDNVNRRWLLARRPDGIVKVDDFVYAEGSVPVPQDGEVLLRTLYFGYDAAQRLWLTERGAGYLPPIKLGEPMLTGGIGQVIASKDPTYKSGDIVEGLMSWEDYALVRSGGAIPLRVLPKGDYPLTWNLSIFGVNGLTAYFGVSDGLNVKPGDTVVISSAGGATGLLAGGISKALGAAKVIGIAGGGAKCRWLVENAGFDAAIDYKSADLAARLAELCPKGVDCYYDNVGGEILDTLLLHMADGGRILICGAISSGYNEAKMQGPSNYMQICAHQLTVKGILLPFYKDQIGAGVAKLAKWVKEGKLRVEEEVIEGFQRAPELLPTMYTVKNPGKLLLHVADPT